MDTATLHGLTIIITIKTAIDDDRTDQAAVLQSWLAVDVDGNVTASQGITVGGEDPETELPVSGVESGVFTHFVTAEQSTRFAIGAYVYDMQITTSHVPPRVKTVIEEAPWAVRGDVTGIHALPEEGA
jgi:hypothetical protein